MKKGLRMIIEETTYARAGLVGNPSDIFNGITISLLFDQFQTKVRLYETPKISIVPSERDLTCFDSLDELVQYRKQFGFYGGIRLIEALIVRFDNFCRENGIALPKRNFTIEYTSNIPFGIGLGGSSAIIKAALSALMRFFELSEKQISKPIQPNIILEAETRELGISAGPQDRVVVVYGGLVFMDFTMEAYERNKGIHGEYVKLDPSLLPPLFIAYDEKLSKSSGAVHNIMRYRVGVEHDQKVLKVMEQKAALADEAMKILLKGDKGSLGPILSRDFDLRKSVYDISVANLRLVQIARDLGAHAKQTGSGGAVIGVYEDDRHYRGLEEAYGKEGFTITPVIVVDH